MASYGGDANFLSSSQGLTQIVSQGNSTVSMTSNRTIAVIGRTVVPRERNDRMRRVHWLLIFALTTALARASAFCGSLNSWI